MYFFPCITSIQALKKNKNKKSVSILWSFPGENRTFFCVLPRHCPHESHAPRWISREQVETAQLEEAPQGI